MYFRTGHTLFSRDTLAVAAVHPPALADSLMLAFPFLLGTTSVQRLMAGLFASQ